MSLKLSASMVLIGVLIGRSMCQEGFLQGLSYSNNSLIDIEDIGVHENALTCSTSFVNCCKTSPSTRGRWQFPNGVIVGSLSGSSTDMFSRTRGNRTVLLHRGINASSPTGIFTCRIPDGNNTDQDVYFGIYNAREGFPVISELVYDINSGVVRCVSIGGPATTVKWSRTGLSFTTSKIILSTVTAKYLSSISIVSSDIADYTGTFACTISNRRGTTSQSIGPFQDVKITAESSFVAGSTAILLCFSNLTVLSIQWINITGLNAAYITGRTGQSELFLIITNTTVYLNSSIYVCKVNISLPNGNTMTIKKTYTLIVQAVATRNEYTLTMILISISVVIFLIACVFIIAAIIGITHFKKKASSVQGIAEIGKCEPHIYEEVKGLCHELKDLKKTEI